MGRAYREFNFDDDMELMNLTYQMNTGNFMNYENENLDTLKLEEIEENKQPKIEL